MELTFKKELFYNCMVDLPALFLAEWEEIIQDNPTQQELSPAWDKYVQMEMAGTLMFFAAWAEDKLVGYILNIIHPNLHFSKTLYAFIDAFYLAPAYRTGEAEALFVMENEIALLEQGVKRINIAIPAATWQYRLMKKLKYARTESIFAKWL